MTSAWAGLGFSARGAMEALSTTSVRVVESDARTRVEVARAEFRNAQVAAGFGTLERMLGGLQPGVADGVPSAGLELAFAIAYSVLGQGQELVGNREASTDSFRESVTRFRALDDAALNARDHSDFGVALAALAEDDALSHLLRSREEGGATPEAARHHALLLMSGGKTQVAEELLKEALLTTPADPDALRALGMIQADREDPEAPATLASAVYALMRVSRHAEAIDVLDFLDPRIPAGAGLTGVRAEAERLDNRLEAARTSYEQAILEHPEQSWLLAGLASTLLALDQADQAEDYVSAALESTPDGTEFLDLAGEIAVSTQDWDRVRQLAERAIALDPRDASAHFRLARAVQQAGDIAGALEVIKSARVLAPTDFDFLALHAELALDAGAYEVATELYRQLCADPQALAGAHARLVWLLRVTDQGASGIAAAETALEKFGDDESLLLLLGELLVDSDPDRAVALLRRAAELPDHDVNATLTLARTLYQLDDLTGALTEIARAKEEAPDSAEVYTLESRVYAYAGDWGPTRVAAQRAIELDPDSVDALVSLGRAATEAGETEEAVSLLRRAVSLSPLVPARYYLAVALLGSAPAEARDLFDEIVEEAGVGTADSLQQRARLHLNEGNLEAAVTDLDAAVSLQPTNVTMLIELADAVRQSGDGGRALDLVNNALALEPDSAYGLAVRATAYQLVGELDNARADLHRATEIDPSYGYAFILLARIAEDPAQTQEHLDKARALLPGDSRVEVEQAKLYAQTQCYAEALATYERLLEERREPDVLAAYIDALRMDGRVEEAVQEGEHALVELGDDPVVRRNLAIALVEAGRREEGIAHLDRLAETVADANSKGDLGWALTVNEQTEQALTMYDEALLAAPQDLWTRNQISNLLSEVGDYEQALAFARGSLELDPASVDSWAQIGWTARQLTPPDVGASLEAFEKAFALLDGDTDDVWMIAALAESQHLAGDPRAEEGFRRALALAKNPTTKGFRALSTAGWCAYRLGELTQASRLFLEAASLEDKPGSDGFDLALVTLCLGGRAERAQKLYNDGLRLIASARHPLIQRGLIQVAIIDIGRARSEHDLDEGVTSAILTNLEAVLAGLPRAPRLESSPTLPE